MRNVHLAIKLSLVAIIASLLAYFLGLQYYLTAGVLGILTVQFSKKDSIKSGVDRFLDGLLGLALASLLFYVFGYNLAVYGVFLLVFSYLSFKLKISVGIAPSTVLVTHLLLKGTFDLEILLNALYLMFIGFGLSFIFNAFYPSVELKNLKKYLDSVDEMVSQYIYMLYQFMHDPKDASEFRLHYHEIMMELNRKISTIELLDKDILFKNDHRYINYLYMRKKQLSYLHHIFEALVEIEQMHPFGEYIQNFILELSKNIGTNDQATSLKEKLHDLFEFYKNKPLPKTRNEFETRALLYKILYDLEYMLDAKIEFHRNYPYEVNK
jgi:uncharacterized membrane protein YgaE (UPF0421/DUF939 family)